MNLQAAAPAAAVISIVNCSLQRRDTNHHIIVQMTRILTGG